jgi:hypothetical protein
MRPHWALKNTQVEGNPASLPRFPFSQNWIGAQKRQLFKTRAIKTLFGIKIYDSIGK